MNKILFLLFWWNSANTVYGTFVFVKCSVARIPRVKMSKEDTLKGQAIVNILESAPCILIILIYPMLFLIAIGKILDRAHSF